MYLYTYKYMKSLAMTGEVIWQATSWGSAAESVVQHGPVSVARRFHAGHRAAHPHQHEIDMSADKDRGIRRQKQKRAKDIKRQHRQQRAPVGTTPKPSKQQAA